MRRRPDHNAILAATLRHGVRSSKGRGQGSGSTQARLRRGVRRRRPVRARRRALRPAAAEAQARPADHRRGRTTSRRRTRPAGTAAAGPARRSRSRCSATPAPPATASSGSRRPPARCSPAASPSRPTGGSTCARSRWSAPGPSDLAAQIDRALPIEPDVAVILIGVNDVTHRVLPAAARCATSPRPYAGSATPGSRWSSAPAPTSAPSSRSRRRSSRSPAPGRAGWRPRRRSRSSRTGGRTVSLGSILGPEFAAAPALLFGPDRFHPSAAGYRSLAARAAPLGAGRARPDPRGRGRARGLPRRGRAADRRPPRSRRSTTPGTELDGTEVGGRRRGVRGLWVELRHRRRQPMAEAEAPAWRGARGRRRGRAAGTSSA